MDAYAVVISGRIFRSSEAWIAPRESLVFCFEVSSSDRITEGCYHVKRIIAI